MKPLKYEIAALKEGKCSIRWINLLKVAFLIFCISSPLFCLLVWLLSSKILIYTSIMFGIFLGCGQSFAGLLCSIYQVTKKSEIVK